MRANSNPSLRDSLKITADSRRIDSPIDAAPRSQFQFHMLLTKPRGHTEPATANAFITILHGMDLSYRRV